MILSTDRLTLRPFEATDLPYIQQYAVQPEFFQFVPLPMQTHESVGAYLEDRLKDQREGRSDQIVLAIAPKDVKILVGTIRLGFSDPAHAQGELGFALNPAYQGRGIMTEAAIAVLTMGFDDFGLHRIWAMADVRNKPSWRLLERLGMTREGHLRQNKLVRDQWRDSYNYSILEDDRLPPESSGP